MKSVISLVFVILSVVWLLVLAAVLMECLRYGASDLEAGASALYVVGSLTCIGLGTYSALRMSLGDKATTLISLLGFIGVPLGVIILSILRANSAFVPICYEVLGGVATFVIYKRSRSRRNA